MYLPDVELHEAASLDDASALLSRYAPDARLLAGGTDVLVDLKTGRLNVHHVITLGGINQLRGMMSSNDGLRIGAMTTIGELEHSSFLKGGYVILHDASSRMAALQVRNVATVGGNIAGAVPCADLPPALMVLKTRLEIWSPGGKRTMPLEELLLGPRETSLQSDEILTAILVPPPPPPECFGAAYERFALREGNAIAVASVAAGVEFESDMTVREARLVLGAVAPMPRLVESVDKLLAGRRLDESALSAAANVAMEAAEPISDIRGSAQYRRELVGILTKRALLKAARRVEGGGA
ncbi:MAG: xanthine dehydrogenase family protein subunit M [Planctomycetes bacterium]|nr:xanthine dehydrogenase family protein subunit M [Planctomycetota bacterium]